MTNQMLLPFKNDRDTGGFFEAADHRKLVYRMCRACGASINPPRARCHHCGSWDTGWWQVSGRGTLHSWTTVTQQMHPAFPVPYTVFVVALQEAPDVHLVGYAAGELDVFAGMPMQVRFEPTPDGGQLPQWSPVTTAGQAR